MNEHVLVLHDIRSAENVGAIFRTADAVGISKIYLTGYTPTPLDRFGRKRSDVAKAALGAEETLSWEHCDDALKLLGDLRDQGFFIVSLEQSPSAIDYKQVSLQEKNVFIVGNEVTGVPQEILEFSDVVAEIPMRGTKESLNVSVATGVALFRILGV